MGERDSYPTFDLYFMAEIYLYLFDIEESNHGIIREYSDRNLHLFQIPFILVTGYTEKR